LAVFSQTRGQFFTRIFEMLGELVPGELIPGELIPGELIPGELVP
jgi:hypothetical protein